MKREYDDYLRDMFENAELALSFVQGMRFEEFIEDEKSQYAVMRALKVISEAARQVPDSVRNSTPEIPWREITGMRNKLMHEYFGASMKVVWRTVQEDLPAIIPYLKKMLKQE